MLLILISQMEVSVMLSFWKYFLNNVFIVIEIIWKCTKREEEGRRKGGGREVRALRVNGVQIL